MTVSIFKINVNYCNSILACFNIKTYQNKKCITVYEKVSYNQKSKEIHLHATFQKLAAAFLNAIVFECCTIDPELPTKRSI